ncbi:dihydrofolate reductase family protein [Microbacterium sp.]|uniref:dihydrofolate reductase family protein n=1 Tax=Microbacterium sp. TaxID=51671 RepID=UPI0039E3B4A2
MTRVSANLFVSLDGYTASDPTPENPMGDGWSQLTAAWGATRTVRERVFGDHSGARTTGVDDAHAAAFFRGVGAEIMGAGMFGLHAFPDDPEWKGWWGDEPSFGTPVYVLTHSAPRPPIVMQGGTTFHFRNEPIETVLAEASEAAGDRGVRIGGGSGVAHAYLRAGLIDDLHLMIAPVVLGRGNRFWDDLGGLEVTHRVSSEVSESGTIHIAFTR